MGLIGNTEKSYARAVITRAARLITRHGCAIHSDAATANLGGFESTVHPDIKSLVAKVDMVLVFGGDGTLLRVARETAGLATPLLGINIGSLGFLTAVSSKGMPEALKKVWSGEFSLEKRALIEVSGTSSKKNIRALAFNDFVISRGIDSRLIKLEVRVDGEFLTHYRCDGLIVSSPTGSTAYSLSAGGSIIHPHADVMELTPICPHTLSNQSVVVSLRSKIEVRVISPRPATILSADAVRICELMEGDVVTIRRSSKSTTLMRLDGTTFFDTLRRKLHWSGASV